MYYSVPLVSVGLHESGRKGVGILPTQHLHAVPQEGREERTSSVDQITGESFYRVHLEELGEGVRERQGGGRVRGRER